MQCSIRNIIVIASLLFAGTEYAAGQPKIEIAGGTAFSLGTIYRGEVIDRTLSLKNVGSDSLIIDRVETSCGCTGTVISTSRIPRGGSGKLKITFNSANFAGRVHKTVTIVTNDPAEPSKLVEFTAEVIDEVQINPPRFWIKDGETGRTLTLTVKIKNNGTTTLTLKSYRSSIEGFLVRLPSSPLKPGEEVDVVAEFTPKKAYPFLAEGVWLATSNQRQKEVYIPIFGSIKEYKFE